MAIDVTDATFEREVIERSLTTPVIVDLWAPWCGPCRTLGPILEKVTDATNGQVVMVKVNVDENPAIAQAFKDVLGLHGLKMPQLAPAVRVLVCGRTQTPSIDAVLAWLPKDVVLKRLGEA